MEFEAVIGLEVHAQLKTATKIFCGCSTAFGAAPNTQVCPVCLGMPGVLPVLNRKVVEYAIRMGLATHCSISTESRFARKNYFYPDLPKGYQISQYEQPICHHGWIDISLEEGTKRIGITRIHMEEDAGKLLHDPGGSFSRVDLNRTGVPLIEIVSEPDMRSPEEAVAYLKSLHSILRYLDICDGNMEEGSFRCDANVSVRPKGSEGFGTRTEIKNVNSFRFIEKALQYEIRRQIDVVLDGCSVIQETRLWDSTNQQTFSMRGKEEAHDYRYFPDPDLVPLHIDDPWIREIERSLPELPDAKRKRFMEVYGLSAYDAAMLTSDRELADYFERCAARSGNPKGSCNWIIGPLLALLKTEASGIDTIRIQPEDLAELIQLIDRGTISGKIAKTVFEEMAASGKKAEVIVQEKGLVQVSDSAQIETIVQQVIAANPKEAAEYRAGKEKLMGFFVGQVMKASRGKANPQVVNEMLKKMLSA
uniref:Aspartyl/glutamyl-tRNA(Asn/Gln) amidotransferase subunit B n=1 Tax=Desulfatirhabdium butyrativorans TaxID=340467 RepID=A0A7C4RSK7_9BACT